MSQGAYEQTCSVDRQTRGLWVNSNVGVRLCAAFQAPRSSGGLGLKRSSAAWPSR